MRLLTRRPSTLTTGDLSRASFRSLFASSGLLYHLQRTPIPHGDNGNKHHRPAIRLGRDPVHLDDSPRRVEELYPTGLDQSITDSSFRTILPHRHRRSLRLTTTTIRSPDALTIPFTRGRVTRAAGGAAPSSTRGGKESTVEQNRCRHLSRPEVLRYRAQGHGLGTYRVHRFVHPGREMPSLRAIGTDICGPQPLPVS